MADAQQKYDALSPEEKKLLDDYRNKHSKDPNHPAHPDHEKHHEFVRGLFQKFGNAAVFGAGATFGADMINKLVNH